MAAADETGDAHLAYRFSTCFISRGRVVAHLASGEVEPCAIPPLMRPTAITELLLQEQAIWMTVPPRTALWMYTTTILDMAGSGS